MLHDDKVDVYVVSDKLQPFSGTIHTRLLDFSGKTLLDQTKDIQAPAQSSAIYLTFDKADLAAKDDPDKSFLVVDLEVAGKNVSRNLLFFDVTHNLDLPVSPENRNHVLARPATATTQSRCARRSLPAASMFLSEISMLRLRIIISICFPENPSQLLSSPPPLSIS